jgi:DNA-binding NarL/FixJ family response regulator
MPNLQIICEVSDGLAAVQKAEQLKPDLILLDIGLPMLSGIEAARQIRTLSPESKILFVSQESDAEVMQAAFRMGACGYVLKSNAAKDLLAAVKAVCAGRQFFSGGLSGQYPTEAEPRPLAKPLSGVADAAITLPVAPATRGGEPRRAAIQPDRNLRGC